VPVLLKRVGDETLVNTQFIGSQSSPSLAGLSGGGFVVVWTDASAIGADPSAQGIKAQLFDEDGEAVGGEFLVNAAVNNGQFGPVVISFDSGRFLVAWTDLSGESADTSDGAIKGRFFEEDGTPIGGEILLNSTTAGNQQLPDVQELAGGGFVATWVDASGLGGDSSGTAIKAQVFGASGARVGGEFLVNTTTVGAQSQPSLVALASGGFAIAWRGAQVGTSSGSIQFQMFDATGTAVGAERSASALTTGTFEAPTMAAVGSGFVLVWARSPAFGEGPDRFEVKGQLFDSAGQKIGGEFTVNTTSAGDQRSPAVEALPDGGFVVAWQGQGGVLEGTNVYAQQFDDSGAKVGTEFIVGVEPEGSQSRPRLAALASGEIVVGWTDIAGDDGDPNGAGVKFQILAPSDAVPTDLDLTAISIPESAREGVGLATIVTTGALNATYSYSIVADSSGGAFDIVGDQLVVVDNSRLDYDVAPVVSLRIRTTDADGNSYEETFEIMVADAPEAGASGGDAILVNTNTDGNQSEPILTLLAEGSYLVTWADWNVGGRGQIYDPAGNPIGEELSIDGAPAAFPEGGFVAVAAVPGADFAADLVLRIYDAAGVQVGSDIPVNSSTAGGQSQPSVAILESGDILVTWTDFGSFSTPDVRARIFDATGVPLGDEIIANVPDLTGSQHHPQAIPMEGGGFLISWQDNRGSGVWAQLFDSSGLRLGDPVLLSGGDPTADYQIVGLEDGGFVVVFDRDVSSGGFAGVQDVVAQVFDFTGARVGGEIVVTRDGPTQVQSIGAAMLEWGGFVVTWAGNDPARGSQIRAQVFDSTGARVGPELAVDQAGGGHFNPRVTGTEEGGFVIAWTDPTQTGGDTSGFAVRARVFENLVEIDGTAGIDSLTGTAGHEYISGLAGNDSLQALAGHDVLDGGAGADTMRGGAGNDTYVVDNAGDQVVEALATDGTDTVKSAVNFTLGAHVENLVLTSTLSVNGTGNGLVNQLTGNGSANRLDGRAGADVMVGGGGSDVYIVDNVGDQVLEGLATDGSDTVQSSVSFTLGAFLEKLILTGAAANGTGNALANQLTGNASANRLDGGSGADVMWGAAGNDTFVADHSGDRAIELDAEGTDKVEASANYQLGAHIENLTLTGTARINGTGNGLANFIVGNDNANVLNGSGGVDTLRGAAGDDIYIVDNAGDRAIEIDALGGLDTVTSSVSFTLGSFVENLTLTGIAVSATGNSLDNFITGNDGANQIDGKVGADLMRGNGGNDTYVVDNAGDRIVESDGDGTDLVNSSVSFTLASFVENLTLTGTGAVNGTGNALANFITGNAAANILDGKAGADLMRGGAGNDTYVVDNIGDRAVEAAAGDGIDTVESSVSFTLAGLLENLTLTGAASINGTGNSAVNALTGNNAANVLNGMAGNDTLVGGGGADDFLFTTALGATNVDQILDLQIGVDDIVLENAVFTGLAVGALDAGAFRTGTVATDADDRILYDSATGALYFDRDGTGSAAAVQFATLDTGLALGAGEFQVI